MNGEYIINAEYVINGETCRCLVVTVGSSLEHAEKVLEQMVNNPTEKDKRIINGGKNLAIKYLPASRCWWNDGCY